MKKIILFLALTLLFSNSYADTPKLKSRTITNGEAIKMSPGRMVRLFFTDEVKEVYGAGISQQNGEIDVVKHGNILELVLNNSSRPTFDITVILKSGEKFFIPAVVADEYSGDNIVHVISSEIFNNQKKKKIPQTYQKWVDKDLLLAVYQGVVPNYMKGNLKFYSRNTVIRKDNFVEVYLKRIAVFGRWKCYEISCKNISNQKISIDWTKIVFKGSTLNYSPVLPEQPILPGEIVPMYFITYE